MVRRGQRCNCGCARAASTISMCYARSNASIVRRSLCPDRRILHGATWRCRPPTAAACPSPGCSAAWPWRCRCHAPTACLRSATGTGYATAVLAQLAAHVVSIERFAAGTAEARTRLARLDIENATLVVADLMNLPADLGRFSRILVHGCLAGYPNALLRCLAPGGLLRARPRQSRSSGASSSRTRDVQGPMAAGPKRSSAPAVCRCCSQVESADDFSI